MKFSASSFKAYDIRGKVPGDLNDDLAYYTAKALSQFFKTKKIVIGRDARLSGPLLRNALIQGFNSEKTHVFDIGMGGTEEIYYAAAHGDFDVGIMITGSHNPADENGLKIVKKGAIPLNGKEELPQIRDLAIKLSENSRNTPAEEVTETSFRKEHIQFLLDKVKISDKSKKLRIHLNPGNGCAGLMLEKLCPHLPWDFTYSCMAPDGHFPHGIPNPLLPENRALTAKGVVDNHADLGIAWDGDFDRCFFYDETGRFIEGYYVVGLLAEALLKTHPHAKIIHDPRLMWNTQEVVRKAGGIPILSKTGHAFIKEAMRREDAIYGGEMSAHHYFKEFSYCDSGMLPWLLIAQLVADSGKTLSEMLEERMKAYPCSGEINSTVQNSKAVIERISQIYEKNAINKLTLDGLSLEFPDWRFNLRASNTEPLLRLNVESRGNFKLMQEKTQELLQLIRS